MAATSAKTLMTDSGGSSSQISAYKIAGKTADQYAHDAAVAAINKALKPTIGQKVSNFLKENYFDRETVPRSIDWALNQGYQSGKNIVNTGLGYLRDAVTGAGMILNDALGDGSSPGSSSGGSGRGSSGGSAGSSYGSYNDVMDLVNQTAMSNNEWSAYQAQLDRDWQKMMSDTAHQREVTDLQAAGLNPVLSAGGNGASTPSGAMGDTDTSNTRLIAEIAMEAIAASSATAGALGKVANKASSGNILSKIISSPFAKTVGRAATNAVVRRLVYKLI